MIIKIDEILLEKACKEIIETILFCLPNAYQGTVFRIGNPPDLYASCITSGIIDKDRKYINWGFHEQSDFSPPGKPWIEYSNAKRPDYEAISWCVEKQMSWTSKCPQNDIQGSRNRRPVLEDYYYMQPVLLHKEELFIDNGKTLKYPKNSLNETICHTNNYVTVAIIKIHFLPNTIKIDSSVVRIIKNLSNALGTKLFSLHLRYQSIKETQRLAKDRLHSYNILADTLRNAISKSGIVFSMIKLELLELRKQWEDLLLERSGQKEVRYDAIDTLNKIVNTIAPHPDQSVKDLLYKQKMFLGLYLPPKRAKNWVRMQIENRWESLIFNRSLNEKQKKEIYQGLEQLKKSIYLGEDPDILASYDDISEPLKQEWTDIIYTDTDKIDFMLLKRINQVLDDHSLNLPNQEKARKRLRHLTILAQIMNQLEQNTNSLLEEALSGYDDLMNTNAIHLKAISNNIDHGCMNA